MWKTIFFKVSLYIVSIFGAVRLFWVDCIFFVLSEALPVAQPVISAAQEAEAGEAQVTWAVDKNWKPDDVVSLWLQKEVRRAGDVAYGQHRTL